MAGNTMATTAERQAAYRKSRPTAGENGERRISTWVIVATLDPDTPEWVTYFRVTR
jgi:hypothetical protein